MEIPLFRCDPKFLPLLGDFELDSLEKHPGTIFGVWANGDLAYFNPGWFDFAAANHGEPAISTAWPIGTSLQKAIPEPLQPFFKQGYEGCLAEDHPWEHVYECSSPDLYREFHMMVFPLRMSEGLLVVNSLHIERSQDRKGLPPSLERYLTTDQLIRQCCLCRRVSRNDNPRIWDWVAEWVETIPACTTHTICETCFGFYYADDRIMKKPVPPRSTINRDDFLQSES